MLGSTHYDELYKQTLILDIEQRNYLSGPLV